jgi:hypothetical protein
VVDPAYSVNQHHLASCSGQTIPKRAGDGYYLEPHGRQAHDRLSAATVAFSQAFTISAAI